MSLEQQSVFTLPAPVAVDRLGRGLAAVQQGALRATYLEERLRDAPVLPLVRMLACAQREAVRGVIGARLVVEVFGELVEDKKVEPALRAALVTASVVLGEATVLTLLDPAAANDADASDPSKPGKGTLAASETLGRRKSLARTAKGDTLVKLLDDPNPDVVENALMNPLTTEKLAIRVAARRPAPAAVLECLMKSRFQTRPAVRKALVMNPHCPPKLAVRLVASLTQADLAEVKGTQTLDADVRLAAERLLDSIPRR
jgi:hypothetical protein